MSQPYNRLRNIMTGLVIFIEHGGEGVDASHDILRSGPKIGTILTNDEVARLTDAGWFRESEFCDGENCDADDDNETGTHSPDCNAWAIFT